MDAVALASTVTSGVVAFAGVGAAYLTSKAEREARASLSSADYEINANPPAMLDCSRSEKRPSPP